MGTPLGNGFEDEAPERIPGDFYRSKSGTPYVSDPTGATVKSGARQGEIKRLAYGRPSGFGEQIANMFSLVKWGERMVCLGLAKDIATNGAAIDVEQLAYYDRESDEFRTAADAIVVAAKGAAEADLDADRGTYIHSVVLDDAPDREWGRSLGIESEIETALASAFADMLDDYSLDLVVTEGTCVHDALRLAGRFDAHARLTRELRLIAAGGEVCVLPAGSVLVLDIKAGRLRLDNQGRIMYWRDYPIQIAAYAGSVPYDTETDTRGVWPYEIRQDWALIAHLNTREAIAGEPAVCSLVLIDIAAGAEAAELCLAAKRWERRTDVMSLQPAEIASQSSEAAPGDTARTPGAPSSAAAPPAAADVPAVGATETPSSVAPTRAQVVAVLGFEHDEGGAVEPAMFEPLEAAYKALDDASRSWFGQVIGDAQRASVGFRAHTTKTLRRFEIYRGLLALCADGMECDEVARALAALAIGDDAPLFPVVTVGHAVGALSAPQAATFAQLASDYVAGRLVALVHEDELLRLAAAA